MLHPPYSPYLIPSDSFHLFLWMKKVLKGKHIVDVEEVTQKVAVMLRSIEIDEFKNFWAVEKSLDKCIVSNGENFEGDWSKNKYTIFYK